MRRSTPLLIGLFLLSTSPLFGRSASYNALAFKPATDVGNYFGVYGSQPIPKGKFSLGFTLDFAEELVILERAGVKVQDLIARELATHLNAGVGLLDWFDIGLLVSAAPYIKFQPQGSTTSETRIRMGDILLNFRLQAVDNEKHAVGLSFLPFVTFPTGNGASFVGNNKFTGGGMILFDTKRFADRFSLAFNAGYEARAEALLARDTGTVPPTDTTMDDLFLYGMGMNVALHPKWDLIGELRGSTRVDGFFKEQHRPIEFDGGFRVYPTPHWALTFGGGGGLLEGIGNPKFRAFAGVAYIPEHKGFERKKKEPPPPPPPVAVADTDGDGVTDDVDRCPTEPGLPENGGCPPQPKVVVSPEEYRILTRPIHFDTGRHTLRKDALPILGTLAEALKAKSEIQKMWVEGHCDERGSLKFNQRLSDRRAQSVKNFLVQHGVDAARLESIGFGESRPVDPRHNKKAWDMNRRVEFVFKEVEGLIVPEEIPQAVPPTLPEEGAVNVPPGGGAPTPVAPSTQPSQPLPEEVTPEAEED